MPRAIFLKKYTLEVGGYGGILVLTEKYQIGKKILKPNIKTIFLIYCHDMSVKVRNIVYQKIHT